MDDEHVTDPQENPEANDHLPAAGEVGNGPVAYSDPVTKPTDDDTNDLPAPMQAVLPDQSGGNRAGENSMGQPPEHAPEQEEDDEAAPGSAARAAGP